MSNGDFNPMSVDAQFATIVEQLKRSDRERWEYQKGDQEYRTSVLTKLDRLQEGQDFTNGRVTALEKERTGERVTALEQEQWKQRGIFAAVAVGVTGLWHWLTRK